MMDLYTALADALDWVRQLVPNHYAVNIVLVHKTNPRAHIILGQSELLAIKQAIDETMACPGAYEMTGSASDGFTPVAASVRQ